MIRDKPMKVIVTGGAGFIGSHLVDKLVELNYHVVVIDNLSSGSIENIRHHLNKGSVEFIQVDLKNREDTYRAITNADVVFHLAANPEVRVSSIAPEVHFNENIVATFNVLEAMRRNDVEKIVFASSSSVYGEPENIPVDETAPLRPVSVYGASKASCESLIHAYSKLYGVNAIILRYANIVGPRLRHGVIYDLLTKLTRNKEVLEVLGDGTQVRSYLYITDAIDATLVAWLKSPSGYNVYNIGNIDWITVNDVVDVILSELNLKNKTRVIYKPVLHGVGWLGDVKRIALDMERIMKLGWKPTLNSKESVRKTTRELIAELRLLE
ncbi:MAG: SDR family NAD(P)-dependent oxidoreductase [Desulfurococcaceae archaeon]